MVRMLGAWLLVIGLSSLGLPAVMAGDGGAPSTTTRPDDDQHPKRHHRKHRKHHHHRHHKHQDGDKKDKPTS